MYEYEEQVRKDMQKMITFLKNEVVLVAAVLLAVISMVFVTPDSEYIGYIDFHTLGILFCLMAVMAGLQDVGLFREIAEGLLSRVHKLWQIVLILVMLCFVLSMLITNDVALITFVPFTFIVLGMLGEDVQKKLLIPVVVMQTIGANLGSMLTPIGNPQNLYLYGKSGLGLLGFLKVTLPYWLVSLVLLTGFCFFLGKRATKTTDKEQGNALAGFQTEADRTHIVGKERVRCVLFLIIFVFCLLVVANVLDYRVVLAGVVLFLLLRERKILGRIDYSLLLTFVGFFVFIGNMGRVPAFRELLQSVMEGNEVLTAVISSQVISNVPAALLLSGFTENVEALILGTNLGGLGTLIASMASLISYKYIVKEERCSKGAYFGYFTVANIVFLILLVGMWVLVK